MDKTPTLLDLSVAPSSVNNVAENPIPEVSKSAITEIAPLTGFNFSVTDFKASTMTRSLLDESGIRVILVRGENKISERPDVAVLLLTFDSNNPKPIENLIFTAKVTKPYRNRLLLHIKL